MFYLPGNQDGSSQDYLEYNTKHAHYTNVKHVLLYSYYKHNLKGSPFGIALIKNSKLMLRHAGTIDCFNMAFQYQIN